MSDTDREADENSLFTGEMPSSAFLAAYLEPPDIILSIAHGEWEGAELHLWAA
jgi:hypothetical protein